MAYKLVKYFISRNCSVHREMRIDRISLRERKMICNITFVLLYKLSLRS